MLRYPNDDCSEQNTFTSSLADFANDDDFLRVVNQLAALDALLPRSMPTEITTLFLRQPLLLGCPFTNRSCSHSTTDDMMPMSNAAMPLPVWLASV